MVLPLDMGDHWLGVHSSSNTGEIHIVSILEVAGLGPKASHGC